MQNPSAHVSNAFSPTSSEEMKAGKIFTRELQIKMYIFRKSSITSEPLVHLKNATAIIPWGWGNETPFL